MPIMMFTSTTTCVSKPLDVLVPSSDLMNLDSVDQKRRPEDSQTTISDGSLAMSSYSSLISASCMECVPAVKDEYDVSGSPHQMTSSSSSLSAPSGVSLTSPSECILCSGCGYEIRDKYLIKLMDDSWHESCLRCFACRQPLSGKGSCYVKDGNLYCREDHAIYFRQRCTRCREILHPSDLVFRCMQTVFHASCFTCVHCHLKFKSGDEFVLIDNAPVCVMDVHHMMMCESHLHGHLWGLYDLESSESNRKTPKRPRTILNAQQRREFKAAFEKSAKPCRKVREQLAKETGLSVRVVQVWFQNQRAKMKKQQRKETSSGCSSSFDRKDGNGVEGNGSKSDSEEEIADSDLEDMEDGRLLPSAFSRPVCRKVIPQVPARADGAYADLLRDSSKDFGEDKSQDLINPAEVTPIEKLYNMHNSYFSFV